MKQVMYASIRLLLFLSIGFYGTAHAYKSMKTYNGAYLSQGFYSLYGSLQQCLSYRDKQAEQFLNVDERKKVQLIWQIAKRTDANGLAKLGDLYLDGLYIPENIPAALACYYQAALHGSGYAKFLISIFYTEGILLPRDLSKSVRWYDKGLRVTNVNRARRMIAQRSLDKYSKIYNIQRGITWYLYAAGQGDQLAQIRLGDIYNQGFIVPEDKLKALKWYSRVAFHNNAFQVNTKYFTTNQSYDAKMVNFQCSQFCLMQEAQWNGESIKKMGDQTACGCLMIEKYRLNELEKYALYQIAGYYENGTVVKKDERIALNLMHSLARQGYAKAAYNLGYMYYNDIGVTNITQSNALAYAWMKMSYPTIRQAGDLNGHLIARMDDAMTEMTPEDRKVALRLYQRLHKDINLRD